MEKNILLIVNGAPKVNFTVTKKNTIGEVKNILKSVIGADTYRNKDTKITFFVNDGTQVPVFDTNQYDKVSLESVWDSMTKPQISVSLFPSKSITKRDEKKEKRNKEVKVVGLTGNKDVDSMIIQNLNDRDLGNFCKVNKEARKLCSDDTFWRNRTFNRFGILGDEVLKRNKEANYKSWRDYYISLVDFLEKMYIGTFFRVVKEKERVRMQEGTFIIRANRDDLISLKKIVEERSQKLDSLDNIKILLKEDLVDPNLFFEYNKDNDFTSFSESRNGDYDEELQESMKLIAADSRFRPLRVLPILIDSGEYYHFIEILSPYFTKEEFLKVLSDRIGNGQATLKVKQFFLPLAVKKGATKGDIEKLFEAQGEDPLDRDGLLYQKRVR